jgi:hypothetical protein
MRLALILDNDENISRWQFDSLKYALIDNHKIDLILVSKTKNPYPKKSIKNFSYYLLAMLSRFKLKSLSTVHLTELDIRSAKKIHFEPIQKGIWQCLPDQVISELSKVDVVIKFGMGLLGETDKIPSEYGVLSYHHGDPNYYRGRPAGFWESIKSEKIMGVIVQKLSQTLDGGVVRAIGFSKVSKTSYKKTMGNMYAVGIPLLRKALNNSEGNVEISYKKSENLFKLPSNIVVFQLLFKQLKYLFQRAQYGAFIQKSWSVGKIHRIEHFEKDVLIDLKEITTIPKPSGFTFVADPAGSIDDSIYCELLNSKTGLGEIGVWDSRSWKILNFEISGHKSYPQVISHGGNSYLFPEISGISAPTLFQLDTSGDKVIQSYCLQGLGNTRHVDATLFYHENHWYLFSSNTFDSEQRLDLYISDDLFENFVPHPKSPIVLDPRNARMAGPIQIHDLKIYRFAQDCSEKYGSKIQVNRIVVLTPNEYSEVSVGSLEIGNASGPHTILSTGDEMWIDFYQEIFDFMAGYRRLISKTNKYWMKVKSKFKWAQTGSNRRPTD